jgi:hypothetical protein
MGDLLADPYDRIRLALSCGLRVWPSTQETIETGGRFARTAFRALQRGTKPDKRRRSAAILAPPPTRAVHEMQRFRSPRAVDVRPIPAFDRSTRRAEPLAAREAHRKGFLAMYMSPKQFNALPPTPGTENNSARKD